jgi:hypothetical protein
MTGGGCNMASTQSKYSLLTLRITRQGFDLVDLARKAHTTESLVYSAMMLRPVPRADAERLLAAYSEMAGEVYTLDNVAMVIEDSLL